MALEQLVFRDLASKKAIVVFWCLTAREVSEKVAKQKCLMGELLALDGDHAAEPISILLIHD
ncbi:hypothetical protein UUA_00145 [Rhodanobacter thiooxydans LCS2]|nr:hypothetical protein UUA_00145 [Rhodanobacter thiooxydans LCS2]